MAYLSLLLGENGRESGWCVLLNCCSLFVCRSSTTAIHQHRGDVTICASFSITKVSRYTNVARAPRWDRLYLHVFFVFQIPLCYLLFIMNVFNLYF